MTKESHEAFDRLFRTIASRRDCPRDDSYTTSLFVGGIDVIGGKVLEEAAELVEAARTGEPKEVIHEAADLIYHVWVLLAEAGVAPEDVREELERREGVSGLKEKQSRPGSKIQNPKSKTE